MADARQARDLILLDAIDACPKQRFEGIVWRVCREGRDPLLASSARGRWSNERVETLYTTLAANGAIAEVHALLASQPVFPTRVRFFLHSISVQCKRVLKVPTLEEIAAFGVDAGRFKLREYDRTQEIADAAHFLGFDGLLVPSARWDGANLVLFTDRLAPSEMTLKRSEKRPIDWEAWKKTSGKA